MENKTHSIDTAFIRKRITMLRELKGVSERQMSLDLDLSKNYITNITHSYSMPSVTVLLAICNYFGISPMDFFDNELDNPALASRVIKQARKLDDNGLNAVLSVANALNSEVDEKRT